MRLTFGIDDLLEQMVARSASDLHVTTNTPPVVRVRGKIERLDSYQPLTAEDTQQLLYRILSSERQKQLEIRRQLDFSHSIPGLARFRVNVYFQKESIAAAFRLIPDELKTLEELGIPSSLHQLATKPRGIVLVTGPTGSGKSTTLAALIDEINRNRSEHILTIEDPIEFLHKHKRCIVNQREIGPDAIGFAEAGAVASQPHPAPGRELRGGVVPLFAPGPADRDPRAKRLRGPRDSRCDRDRRGRGARNGERRAAGGRELGHGRLDLEEGDHLPPQAF